MALIVDHCICKLTPAFFPTDSIVFKDKIVDFLSISESVLNQRNGRCIINNSVAICTLRSEFKIKLYRRWVITVRNCRYKADSVVTDILIIFSEPDNFGRIFRRNEGARWHACDNIVDVFVQAEPRVLCEVCVSQVIFEVSDTVSLVRDSRNGPTDFPVKVLAIVELYCVSVAVRIDYNISQNSIANIQTSRNCSSVISNVISVWSIA